MFADLINKTGTRALIENCNNGAMTSTSIFDFFPQRRLHSAVPRGPHHAAWGLRADLWIDGCVFDINLTHL